MGESVYSDNRWMPPTKKVGIWGAPLLLGFRNCCGCATAVVPATGHVPAADVPACHSHAAYHKHVKSDLLCLRCSGAHL